jgi:ABC-type uncharacterized transport system auxiliary subunit
MKKCLTISVALMLAGCASGTNYNPASVSQLQPGIPREEVVKMLGKPNSVTTMANGQTILVWARAKVSPFGASSRSVSLMFGPDGKLLQTYQNQTQVQ